MLSFVAQTPPPAAVASWLEVLFYLTGGAAALTVLFKQWSGKSEETTIKGQPLEVKAHEYAVTRDELTKVDTALHGRLKRERAEINEQITRVEKVAADRADKLEAKLDANTSMTQAMGGQVSQINQNVHLILTTLTKK